MARWMEQYWGAILRLACRGSAVVPLLGSSHTPLCGQHHTGNEDGRQAVDRTAEPLADADLALTPLPDLLRRPLTDLLAGGDTALDRAIQDRLDSLDDGNDVLSAFSSALPSS